MNEMLFENNTFKVEQIKPPKKITGTKFGAILGANKYSTPFQTWLDITHSYEFPFEDTKFTQAGKIIEPKQALYMKQWFPNLTTPIDNFGEDYFNSTMGNFFKDEIFGGMWDYLDGDKDHPKAVFEMKTAMMKKKDEWEEDIPESYALQAALYAYLLGVDDVYMVASFLQWSDYQHPEDYIPTYDNTKIIKFQLSIRYPNFENDYIKPAIEWWNKYVITGISPTYTDADLIYVDELKKKIEEDKFNVPNLFDTIKDDTSTVVINNESNRDKLDLIIKELNSMEELNYKELEKYSLKLSTQIYLVKSEKLLENLEDVCYNDVILE